MIPPTRKATFIGPAPRRRNLYGANHPLAIPRVSLAHDLIRAYGAITDEEYLPARAAADFELGRFHTADYVAAVRHAEALGRVRNEHRVRYRLGTVENPWFEQIFTAPAVATGGSIQAAEQVIGGRIGFNPAGGMHHARAGHAEGFCYFNDPVLAILRLRREGWRVLYVDIDAHLCDGVEEAFLDDPAVLTLSLHMDTSYAYPFRGGALEDRGTGAGGFTTLNAPLPRDTHDAEYRRVFDAVWTPTVQRFAPDAIVLQAGTDTIGGDPLGRLRLSTQCFLHTAEQILQAAPRHRDGTPRLLVTGGGGYHPLLVARAWTGLWALLSGRILPEAIPADGAAVLRAADRDRDEDKEWSAALLVSRLDRLVAAPVRPEIERLVEGLLSHPFLR